MHSRKDEEIEKKQGNTRGRVIKPWVGAAEAYDHRLAFLDTDLHPVLVAVVAAEDFGSRPSAVADQPSYSLDESDQLEAFVLVGR